MFATNFSIPLDFLSQCVFHMAQYSLLDSQYCYILYTNTPLVNAAFPSQHCKHLRELDQVHNICTFLKQTVAYRIHLSSVPLSTQIVYCCSTDTLENRSLNLRIDSHFGTASISSECFLFIDFYS